VSNEAKIRHVLNVRMKGPGVSTIVAVLGVMTLVGAVGTVRQWMPAGVVPAIRCRRLALLWLEPARRLRRK
jgi:hypothetical protein